MRGPGVGGRGGSLTSLTTPLSTCCTLTFLSQIMAEVPGNVKVILTDSDFQKELIVAGDKLVIVGFFATW